MTRWHRVAYGPLFFHFGVVDKEPSDGPPLVCLNGSIMVDSGNEARSYLLVCQDRYPVYAALGGMRCLLFVRDDEHVRQYESKLAAVARHLNVIRHHTGPLLDCTVPEPLYVACDIDSPQVELRPCRKLLQQIGDPQVINSHVRSGIFLNQLAPTVCGLIARFYELLKNHGIQSQVDPDACHRAGRLALKWHDKSHYVELLKGYEGPSLPTHVPTAVFSSSLLEEMTWEQLTELFRRQTGCTAGREFFVKSAMDSAGEICAIVDRENFVRERRRLTDEIAEKVRDKGRTQKEVSLLVQPRIETAGGAYDLPTSIGLTYHIHDTEHARRLVLTGHVYEDAQRKTFMGTYLSDALTREVLRAVGEEKIVALMRLFARQVLRGPVNLDAVRNVRGHYVFVYDCNPRMGGVFPSLMLKSALQQAGFRAETLLSLGYRGRIVYPDLQAKLVELKAEDLLYTGSRQRGVYLLPSLVRPDSFDVVLLNMEMARMRHLIDSGLITSLSDESQCDLQGVYL